MFLERNAGNLNQILKDNDRNLLAIEQFIKEFETLEKILKFVLKEENIIIYKTLF